MRLAAGFTHMLIPVGAGIIGADRESNKAAVDQVGFCGRQLAGAPANQYSVLIIHAFSFHDLDPMDGSKGLHTVVQTGPHSPMEASPSLLGHVAVGTVQAVSVFSPPLTLSTSCSVKARAPRRISTLFWSFIHFS